MHGLAVRQKNNPQAPALHLVNLRPKPDAAVGLNPLPLRRCNNPHSSRMNARSGRERVAMK